MASITVMYGPSRLIRWLSPERAEVEGQLRILRWADTPHLSDRLGAAHAAMDSGKKIDQEALEALVTSRRKAKA